MGLEYSRGRARARAAVPIGLLCVEASFGKHRRSRTAGSLLSIRYAFSSRWRGETSGKVGIVAFDYAARSDCTAPASIGTLSRVTTPAIRPTLDVRESLGLRRAPAFEYVAFENCGRNKAKVHTYALPPFHSRARARACAREDFKSCLSVPEKVIKSRSAAARWTLAKMLKSAIDRARHRFIHDDSESDL